MSKQDSYTERCAHTRPRDCPQMQQQSELIILTEPMKLCIQRAASIWEQIQLVDYVRSTNTSNVYGARVPLASNWNLQLLQQLTTSTSDREVVQFLRYGWPLNHDGSEVSITIGNHASAEKYPEQMQKYIHKEISHGCLIGPFWKIPWTQQVAVSPMSTRPKKGSTSSRRILMDLSWPRNGRAVNDGISTEEYMGQQIQLVYPTVDKLCKRAYKMGKNVKGWKKDMDRAFKQIFMCPKDWPLQGISYSKWVMFDKTAIMGSCSAPYVCQRTTNVIRHIMVNLDYFVVNYVDDFMGLDLPKKAQHGYQALGHLLRDLGVSESEKKSIPPSDIIEFLGVLYNLAEQTISITPERLQELLLELEKWTYRTSTTRNHLEKLLGKLQFVSNCVRPGRIMVNRLRQALRGMNRTGPYPITPDMRADIEWWNRFLPKYDKVSIMWMQVIKNPDARIASDACLQGIGAVADKQYYHQVLPQQKAPSPGYGIVQFEMMALVISLRKWGHQLTGLRVKFNCDNMGVVDLITSGFTKNDILQEWLRELAYICAINKFEIVTQYIQSEDNRKPDLLSRWETGVHYREQFLSEIDNTWEEIQVTQNDMQLHNTW